MWGGSAQRECVDDEVRDGIVGAGATAGNGDGKGYDAANKFETVDVDIISVRGFQFCSFQDLV